MSRKLSYFLGVAACGALLASCGGGNNDNGGTPTPSPTATGSGTPTPSPTATPTPTAIDFDFAEDFVATSNAVYGFAYFTPNSGGTETFSDGNRISGSSRLTYTASPENARFEFSTLTGAQNFAGTDRDVTSTTLRSYTNSNGRLILELPYEFTLRGTYERTDPFTRETVPGTLRSRRVAIYLNPVDSATAVTSTLTFTGQPTVAGGTPGTTVPTAVSVPQRSFTINPGSNPTLTGSLPIFVTQNGAQNQVALLAFTTTSTDNINAFSGTLADSGAGFTGTFAAAFSGPNREELVIIYEARHASDGRKFVGSFIGRR